MSRYQVTQRILADSPALTWVVWDTQDFKVVSTGSYVSCANECRDLNANAPQTRLTQKQIDGVGDHRRRFFAVLLQLKQTVFPSTQVVK